jgi:hypothetical protein
VKMNRNAARRAARKAEKAERHEEIRIAAEVRRIDALPWAPLEFFLPDPNVPDKDGTPVGTWENRKYVVLVTVPDRQPKGWPPVLWLSLRRQDRQPITDWRDMQRIKNEIAGCGSEGVQLFPSEHRLVDTSNQYALFCIAPGSTMPFGWMQRAVSFSETPPDEVVAEAAARGLDVSGARQRPLDRPEHRVPKGLPVVGPAWAYAGIELEEPKEEPKEEPAEENIVDVEVAATRPPPTPKALKDAVVALGFTVPASFKTMSGARVNAWMDRNLSVEDRARVRVQAGA